MTPESIALSGSEDAEQTALFMWFAMNQHIPDLEYAFAIPNGGERNKIVAARLKAQGVKRGVPDICIPVIRAVDSQWYAGLWIEMKKIKGSDTKDPDQLRWADHLKRQGYMHALCRGFLAARPVVKRYFGTHLNWRDTL